MTENNNNKGGGNGKAMAYLAYILFIIPLLAGSKDDFTRYHTNQGVVFFIVTVIGGIILAAIPVIGWAFLPFFYILVVVWFIIGIVNVSKGVKKPLPLIGGIKLL